MKPYLKGDIFRKLKDIKFFNRVQIGFNSVVWKTARISIPKFYTARAARRIKRCIY